MRFSAPRSTIFKALRRVIGILEPHQVLPILSHVMLEVEGSRLRFVANNSGIQLEAMLELDAPATVGGSITVPGRKLADICQALPEAAVIDFSFERGRLLVQSDYSLFHLATLPAAEFPCMAPPPQEAIAHFSLASETLHFLIARTHFAIGQEDVRAFLNGLLLERNLRGTLFAVATDGHRLALNQAPVMQASHEEQVAVQAIIPRKTVTELLRLVKEGELVLNVSISDRHIYIQGGSFSLISHLIQHRYPQYQNLIPEVGDIAVQINCALFKAALTRAAIFAKNKFCGVRLQLRQGFLRILANGAEQESAQERVAVEYEGHEIDACFNAHYLLDILAIVDSQEIAMLFCGAKHTALIKDPAHPNSTFVVMPVTL